MELNLIYIGKLNYFKLRVDGEKNKLELKSAENYIDDIAKDMVRGTYR